MIGDDAIIAVHHQVLALWLTFLTQGSHVFIHISVDYENM